jgi:hypothetical protein
MKSHPSLLKTARVIVVAVLALTARGGLFVTAATAGDATPATKAMTVRKLTGAELYAINCNRCHPGRYPTEFSSVQWPTLLIHMRVRANLPAKQAREILNYLKQESGN